MQQSLVTCRTITLLLLSCLLTSKSYGQDSSSLFSKVYVQTGAVATNRGGGMGEMSLQVVFRNKWSATISNYSGTVKPKNLPNDYVAGSGSFLGLSYGGGTPSRDLEFTSLTAGRFFKLSRSVWFTGEAGLSITKGQELVFTRQPVSVSYIIIGSSTSSNYNAEKVDKTAAGAMLKGDLAVAVLPFVGIGFGTFVNFNPIQTQVGAEVKFILGWMHRGPKDRR
jgi:hypothetical protein